MKRYRLLFVSKLASHTSFIDISFFHDTKIKWNTTIEKKGFTIELYGSEDWGNVVVKSPLVEGSYTLGTLRELNS